jgi:hypothetical protein
MPEPVQGPACYFPSIQNKHGRPVSYWLDLIGASPLTRHKELPGRLKAGHPSSGKDSR